MELNTRNFTANTVDFMAGLRLKDTTGSKYGPNRKVCVCMGGGARRVSACWHTSRHPKSFLQQRRRNIVLTEIGVKKNTPNRLVPHADITIG